MVSLAMLGGLMKRLGTLLMAVRGGAGGAAAGAGGLGNGNSGGLPNYPNYPPQRPPGGPGHPGQKSDKYHNIDIGDLIDLVLQPQNMVEQRGDYKLYHVPGVLTDASGKVVQGRFEISVSDNRITHYFFKPGKKI